MRRGRLFAIDVLAGTDCALDHAGAHVGRRGVEENYIARIGQRRIEIGAPALHPVFRRQLANFFLVSADQDRIGQQPPIADPQPALIPDLRNRAFQMLVGSHPAGNSEHDDADPLRCAVSRFGIACADIHIQLRFPVFPRCRAAAATVAGTEVELASRLCVPALSYPPRACPRRSQRPTSAAEPQSRRKPPRANGTVPRLLGRTDPHRPRRPFSHADSRGDEAGSRCYSPVAIIRSRQYLDRS